MIDAKLSADEDAFLMVDGGEEWPVRKIWRVEGGGGVCARRALCDDIRADLRGA